MRNFFENRMALAATLLAFAGAMVMGGMSGNASAFPLTSSESVVVLAAVDDPSFPPFPPPCPTCASGGDLNLSVRRS